MLRLSKWYCDCVALDDTVFIGDAARLRWGPIPLDYSASLLARPAGPVEEHWSLRRSRPPVIEGDECSWWSGPLGLEGRWRREAEPVASTLPEAANLAVQWTCHFPRAAGNVRLPTGENVTGLGYVEELTVLFTPWTLPPGLLHWGRFLAGGDAVTWIDWSGGASFRLACHNGVEYQDAVITNDHVRIPAAHLDLSMSEMRELRSGRLIETAFTAVPGARWIAPARLKTVYETRWLSRGRLSKRDGSRSTGWVIHESVWMR